MSSEIAVVILAGGEGSRIGGNKPLRKVGEVALIDRALADARRWSDLVALSVRSAAQPGPVEVPLLVDDPSIAGPLAALVSALRFGGEKGRRFVLTIPVDMPFLPRNLCERLERRIRNSSCAIASSGGQLHPVCGLWRTSLVDEVPHYLAGKQRSLIGFARKVGFEAVEWPCAPADPFFNINTMDDLAQAEIRLR